MKKLGLIGGTSWHSTIEYYRNINQLVNDHFGDNTNPPLMVYTLNQFQIHRYQIENNWRAIARSIIEAAWSLERAGVEAVMFCANTPHKVYEVVEEKVTVPIIHIADATAQEIKSRDINKVCFIGTRFTMEETFLIGRISKYDIEVQIPEEKVVIEELHRIIQKELTYGVVHKPSKQYVMDTLKSMIDNGAEGVILGCTEFPLMISNEDLTFPIFNTTEIHSRAATHFILSSN
ncbi:amino acid racemase [Fulvivirga sp. M361]|uniref:aspartate/glutamate racemase family protein n=1 Tax=Fulvivirga sp. M361 TaxID=2594266 RepID=UPI00117BCE6B|nr:amino acid racemase [Fulvivirga sp. M361]TRX59359.1 amino acid racemase [Fulvivirga sp. M361]